MNAKLTVPEHVPAELHDMYREFLLSQMIQQLLADHGATRFQAQKICGFVAVRCALQHTEPETVVQVGTGFMENYRDVTEKYYNELLEDPVMKLRLDAQSGVMRKLAVAADMKSPVKMNITEEMFNTKKPEEQSRILLS